MGHQERAPEHRPELSSWGPSCHPAPGPPASPALGPQPLTPGALTREPDDRLHGKLPLPSQVVIANHVSARIPTFFTWQVEIKQKSEKSHPPVLPTAWSMSLVEAPASRG